jgi:hypothetical protein
MLHKSRFNSSWMGCKLHHQIGPDRRGTLVLISFFAAAFPMSDSLAQALSQSASSNPLLWIVGVLLVGEILSRIVTRLTRGGRSPGSKAGRDCPHCVACRGKSCSGRSAAA